MVDDLLTGFARSTLNAVPRRAVRPPFDRVRPPLVPRHELLPKRCVEMYRAGPRPSRFGNGPAGHRSPVASGSLVLIGRADFAEPSHRVPEQLDLVDRLVGARRSHLGRAV